MKKLELKNLTVKKLSKTEMSNTKGGLVDLGPATSGYCNDNSVWPVRCTSIAWNCGQ